MMTSMEDVENVAVLDDELAAGREGADTALVDLVNRHICTTRTCRSIRLRLARVGGPFYRFPWRERLKRCHRARA